MSHLPRLAAPRTRSQRVAALLPSPPRRASDLRRGRARPPAPAGPPPQRWQGPLLLVQDRTGAEGERRCGECRHVWQCEEDWIAAGERGQARCPAGCPVWLVAGGEGE